MIENLLMLMSFFRLIKWLVRLLVRVVDTDWMFVFPRLHSQHASARSEGSPRDTFFGVEKWLQQERTRPNEIHRRLELTDSIPDCFLPVWYSLISSGSEWKKPTTSKADITHFYCKASLDFSIKFSFGTSKCARNIFSHMFEDFMSVVMHFIH